MKRVKKLLQISCWLALAACNPDSRALDSSENLLTAPKNVVQALTLEVPWACWQVSQQKKKPVAHISNLQALKIMKLAECENRELNQAYPHQTRITVVVHLANIESDSTLYVRYVPLYFADSTVDRAARKLLRLGGFPASLDPSTAVIESAAGTYKSASSYLRAIRTTTPLIVFLPMPIQGKKLTPAIYQAACTRVKVHTLFPE